MAVAIGLALTTISAQIPGRNVNMVAGTEWPNGDPFLQRQNEPSIAASTRNPLHLLGGSNDYRTVDVPGLPGDEIGDAWLGLYKSFDGGQRWISTLLPGYPQDTSPEGVNSPIHGYGAGADAVVRAGTNGLIYYAGLAFDRSNPNTPTVPGKSAIFVARFIDNNNKEAGDTFQYLGTRTMQTDPGGVGGNFLDKPWLAVDIPRDTARCTIVTPGEKGPITQSIPAGPVYVAYTLKSRDAAGERYDIMFSRSSNCGDTWSTPVRINNAADRGNQGASIAIEPKSGDVYVAWRHIDTAPNGTDDRLMTARFKLPNKKFDPPGVARRFPKGKKKGLDVAKFFSKGGANQAIAAAQLSSFDQGTSKIDEFLAFRTNAYPTLAVDDSGRVYMAWTERGFEPNRPDPAAGDARILIATTTNGHSWTTPQPVSLEGQLGHQFMPALAFSGGKLILIYYDLRETSARVFSQYIDDITAFLATAPDERRHTLDVRVSMATPGATPVFGESVRVSDYLIGADTTGRVRPLQVNPPNLPMFMQGTAPFIGDYIDVTSAPQFVVDSRGRWIYNTAISDTPPIFHAVWTDNRDVRPPRLDLNNDGNPWNDYAPPGAMAGTPSLVDPSQVLLQCVATADGGTNAGSRNQNIYTARITGGMLAGSPGNTKTLSTTLQRSFVVFVQNTTAEKDPKIFRLTIVNQPPGGRASFEQFPQPPYTAQSPPPLTVIEAVVPRFSTVSRTVYVTSSDPHARIDIRVEEIGALNGTVVTTGLRTNIVLNPDIDNPDIDNPDIDNPDIDNPDIDNAEVRNPDIDNPDIDNPDIDNPDIDNPDIDNPDIDNVRIANPDIDNPDIDNPDIDNPDIDNPDIDNPDIDNPDIDNQTMTDISWSLTNTGNTTAAYNVNLFFAQTTFDPELVTQLVLHRTYKTPVVKDCLLKTETRNVVVANVPNPQLVRSSSGTLSNPNDPSATNATIYLAPGESGKITLRIYDPDKTNNVLYTDKNGNTALIDPAFVPSEDVTVVVQQQSVNSEEAEAGVTEPPPVVQFPSPEAVTDRASTAENTPVTLNVLANDSTAFGSTKIISFHPDGMAAHAGASVGDVVYQPSSGYLYTQRGAVDPATDALVGRFPAPPGALGIISHQANARTGINYGRASFTAGPGLFALDARPDSATFHNYLPMPVLADPPAAIAIDAAHHMLYVVHGPTVATAVSPTTVSAIDIEPGSASFHQVVGSVSLPTGIRGTAIAVNTRTERVYVGAFGIAGGNPGGVFMIDTNMPVPAALRITGVNSSQGFAINEAANLVFASSSIGNNFALYAIDGASNAVATVTTALPARFGAPDERLVVHEASGKVLMRLENTVVVIDGQRGSPTRNTVLATINVGAETGGVDIAIDQELGLAVTVGNFGFQADVIDIAANALAATVPLNGGPADVAIDPINHRAFVGVFTYVEEIALAPIASTAQIPVFIESGGIVLNPSTNKAYAGILSQQASIGIFSGAGAHGTVAGAGTRARYLFSARHDATNQHFIVNQANEAGTSYGPGSLMVIDGADTLTAQLDTLPNPFGIGINQASGKVYVASNPGASTHGGITIFDANNLAAPPQYAQGPSGPLPGGFPQTAPTSLLGFARHVVVNPATNRVYALQTGGSPASLAVLDPATNVLTPLDGVTGSPIFDAQQAAGETWGRAVIIRVHAGLNRIYAGMFDPVSSVYRVIALDGTTHAVVGTFVGGGHSNRHTPSFIAVNEPSQRLYVVNYNADTVTMLNAATLDPLATTTLPDGPSATAYNVAAKRLYVSSIDAKTITAIDAGTLAIISTVRLPLVAYFLYVDEVESRIYTSGGDSPDESGLMVVTDVLGQLGTNVSVTSVGSTLAGGAAVLNADYSVTYTPPPGYSGPDSFSYNITAPTGTAVGTVNIDVVATSRAMLAFGDTYSVTQGQALNVAAPGPLANDAVHNTPTFSVTLAPEHGTLDAQPDGSFTYTPDPGFEGVDSFKYVVQTDTGDSNAATVFLSVTSPTSLVVTNTNDSGAGSLRQALAIANVESGAIVSFNIPGEGPHVIQPLSQLTLSAPAIIDGYTQPGSEANASAFGQSAAIQIQLQGTSAPAFTNGLQITGGGATVRGLSIVGFSGAGLLLDVLGNNIVEGNFIGITTTGAVMGNNGGVVSQSAGNQIGVAGPAGRNLISGNSNQGIRVQPRTLNGVVQNSGAGTVIVNNLVGTDAAGLLARPNTNGGISVSVPNVRIGGASALERNVISGNSGNGVNTFAALFDPDGAGPLPSQHLAPPSPPDGLLVQGNYIGVGVTGAAVPNTSTGLQVNGTATIGGPSGGLTCVAPCNVISGNGSNGLGIGAHWDSNTGTVYSQGIGTQVLGNFIGLDPSGAVAVPNGQPAPSFSAAITVNAPNVVIGTGSPVTRNVIAGNHGVGISIGTSWRGAGLVVTTGANASIRGNYIGVAPDGVTPRGNGNSGITFSVPGVTIGGMNAGDANVISGSTGFGINAFGTTYTPPAGGPSQPVTPATLPEGAKIFRNLVGTNAAGDAAIPNTAGGMTLSAPAAQVIGNLISGNTGTGLSLGNHFDSTTGTVFSRAEDAVVEGNLIGVRADGLAALPNNNGISISAERVRVGGSTPQQRNVIAGNNVGGISIFANTTAGNVAVGSGFGSMIAGNYIGIGSDGATLLTNSGAAISSSVSTVTIGGATAADGNYIAAALNGSSISLSRQSAGASFLPSGYSTVQHNIIGLGVGGNRLSARGMGISVGSEGNQILSNTIAGNGTGAIPTTTSLALTAAANMTVVRGNFIGTNAAGNTGIANFGAGITIFGSSDSVIGGPLAAHRNVVVGGNDIGIFVSAGPGQTAANNTIQGNYIGVLPDGQTALGTTTGVMIYTPSGSVTGTRIGGSGAADGNVVAGNTQTGISVLQGGLNTIIEGNLVGVAADATTPRGNANNGISVDGGVNTSIGGAGAAENVIANNTGAGVRVTSGSGNHIHGNRILNNTGLGIDLGAFGVLANDAGDGDAGANNQQNYPVLSNATNTAGATTRVDLDVTSFAAGSYTIRFFANTGCDASGHGEGERLIHTFTGFLAPASGQFFLSEAVPQGQFITATATDAAGNTSEFSNCAEVDSVVSFAVTNTNDSGAGSLRQAITNANNTAGQQTITFNIPGAGAGSPAVITVASQLPTITDSVIIDATSQPGWDGLPVVNLRSPSSTTGWDGLFLAANNITVKGLSVSNFLNGILAFQTYSGHLIEQNIIGTTRANGTTEGNGLGLQLRSSGSTVQNNVIANNGTHGLYVVLGANNNTIRNNKIGMGTDGMTLVPNGRNGIELFDGPGNNVIEDNLISGNGIYGISLANNGSSAPVSGTIIRNNVIGLDANGNVIRRGVDDYIGNNLVNYGPKQRGNLADGINVESAPGTIIGEFGKGNTISGNTNSGVRFTGTFTSPPIVQYNRIGTDPTGMLARGNVHDGVRVEGGAGNFTIGGTAPNSGNVISANLSDGIEILNGHNINVYQNVIGLAADAVTGLGNGLLLSPDDPGCCHAGVTVTDGNAGIAIGAVGGQGNLISGNHTGVWLGASIATRVEGNRIGLTNLAPNVVPNTGDAGVALYTSIDATVSGNQIVGSTGNAGVFIYGASDTIVDDNVIRGSTNVGIVVANYAGGGPNAGANRLRRNSIYDNGGIGIDLNWDGVTPNDPGDGDGDPNGRQNYPVLSNANNQNPNTRVTVDTTSFAPGNYAIHLYSSVSCDASGHGEGEGFVIEEIVGSGGVVVIDLPGTIPVGRFITATATGINGDTSEFSNCTAVTP